jgi:hypothetical protein
MGAQAFVVESFVPLIARLKHNERKRFEAIGLRAKEGIPPSSFCIEPDRVGTPL